MVIRQASDRSLLLIFDESGPPARGLVHRATQALSGLAGVVNLHPAYASVLIDYDPRLVAAEAVERAVRERAGAAAVEAGGEERLVEIPVVYDGEDLPDVARLTGLSEAEVVRRHAAAEYTVCFLGFSPGFPYLSGLPAELAVPRLGVPRKRVPAGSVAIGGAHTGVYPVASPGGWRIIGRTEARLFRPEEEPPVLLRMGDRVRFARVSGP